MNCTNCSSPVKPIATFDIDGTMGEYHQHFCEFAATYLGYSRWDATYDGGDSFRLWFCGSFNVDIRTFREIKLAYRQGGQKRSMPVRHWSRVACKVARDCGAEIWVTTTRPYMRLDNIDPDTRFWLTRHGIKYDYLIYGDYKYEDLAQQVDPERVCFLIDDLDEQLDQAQRLFDPASCFLGQTKWNRAYHHAYQGLDSGEAILKTIDSRIEEWKTKHS